MRRGSGSPATFAYLLVEKSRERLTIAASLIHSYERTRAARLPEHDFTLELQFKHLYDTCVACTAVCGMLAP